MKEELSKLSRMFKDDMLSNLKKKIVSPLSLQESLEGHITTWRLRQRAYGHVLPCMLVSFAARCGPVAELWLMKVSESGTCHIQAVLEPPTPTLLCVNLTLAPSAG